MPTDTPPLPSLVRLAVLAAFAALSQPASAQTDDTTPFYAGGSLGVAHVSNIYRDASKINDDTVVSAGVLAGIDQRLGRQHLALDGSLQNNRYSTNSDLNYRSHSLRGALNWQTIRNLSGVLSAKSDRSMADFNIGSDVKQVFEKNIETNSEYQAIARLGVATRYTLEGGWTQQKRNFTAWQYDRLTYRQNISSLGIYATPAGNVRLGLVGRRTSGQNPRYPDGRGLVVVDGEARPTTSPNDYTRDDIDFTTQWTVGGHSTLNTRISRSKKRNSLDLVRDFNATTGAINWNWQPTGKLQIEARYARDTGQESTVRASDLDRVFSSWQLGSSYALTGKLSLSARASTNRSRYSSDANATANNAFDDAKAYNFSLRWAFSRGLSLSCQYDHIKRGNSVPDYAYTTSSYGCTGQAILY